MFNFAGKKDITSLDSNLNEILSKIERLEEIQKQNSNKNQAKLEAIDKQLVFKENYEKIYLKCCELLKINNQLKRDISVLHDTNTKSATEVERLRKALIHKEKLIRELKKQRDNANSRYFNLLEGMGNNLKNQNLPLNQPK